MQTDAAPQAGDFVLGGEPEPLPAGKIEGVLAAPSGDRLLIARAYSPGAYLVAPAAEVAGSEVDAVIGLRWHRVRPTVADLVARGVFRRTLGRLGRDPLPAPLPPLPDDRECAAALRRDLAADPLVAGGELEVRVLRGVAALDGWVRTIGAKMAADRLARTTPGIWEAVNRLVSDEELRVAVRTRLLAAASVAAAVARLHVELGRVTVFASTPHEARLVDEVTRRCGAVPGVRAVAVRPG